MCDMQILKTIAVFVLFSFLPPCNALVAAKPDTKPNILVIMTDQQAWDAVGYSGNQIIKTPHMDRLAREGVNFSHAITPCAVCVPARVSILTGRLTETTKIRENGDAKGEDSFCYYPSFDDILDNIGYRTEYYGKFHAPKHMATVYENPGTDSVSGFDQIINWEPLYVDFVRNKYKDIPRQPGELYEETFYGGTITYKVDPPDICYKYMSSGKIPSTELIRKIGKGQGDIHGVLNLPAEDTITAIQGKQALEALDRLKDERFILTVSFHCPHVPITPSEPYASMYKAEDMPPPVSIRDKRSNSPYYKGRARPPYDDMEKVKYMIANYYAFVTEIDDWIGKLLDKLDIYGLTKNTLVVFVSDHGEMLGAHGMRGKFNFYEESVRVPLVIRYPKKIKAGQTISTPVSVLNIFPTIMDYAGLPSVPTDGYSLRGVMEGTETPKYDFAVSEWQWTRESVPSIMIRTDKWKLMTTHRRGGQNVEVLFDLENDPHEMNNLLGTNPERFKYRERAEILRSKLVSYLQHVNYPLTEEIEQREIIRKDH
ncbi:sulfatase-like hydrolase/transferase [Planctomycetota bacterium]